MYFRRKFSPFSLYYMSSNMRKCVFWANANTKDPDQLVDIQSTLVISNSKGLIETLRDIRTSTNQSWESEENNKLNNHI